ncbi:major intracellular serine protease [Paenibacillus jamilae]|jgi:major intracellular serine protease|uniref:S8 family peptidase n=1 Tax=Paenibacillus TaxID=44249 RepID=UPI0008AD869C|nr:S8 family peptidase [Paenibacillus polymyxa]MDP9677142.1 major intracellular serine protease [Paenibacillus jamilae]MBY0021375.1 S8 family peptidase [Paenibacillus polymyxa]MBY0055398.1 S8 family peptidase [Paenibacillus polymyxa]MBY0072688.1 S8 family peptidase [Paenibacillus polymyxa]MBY0081758.1 S8 family peptidase [Paenibacillus polymyxa]
MERKVHIIPYQVIKQEQQVNEIPRGVEMIQAPAVWNQTRGRGVKVAVLDTGCDADHPDLKARIIGGRNFTDDDEGDPEIFKDYNGHGTHVAGTIAAAENENGVVGVAPEADLLIIKVLNKQGSGQYDWIIQGIYYAIEQKVDIISMSLGGPEDVPELHEAVKKAVASQILVICAAGNEGDGDDRTDELGYPGCYNEVISVGAINFDRHASEFSNSNNEVDLVAPGEDILSTVPGGKYATFSGTSMATPHVAGALALIKQLANASFERDLTEPELYAQLIKRTIPLGNSPKMEGNGLLYLTAVEELSRIFDTQRVAEILSTASLKVK